MAGALEEAGYVCTEEASDADVLIYNTCSIREKAENKVYSALGKQVYHNFSYSSRPAFEGLLCRT
jgi:tRNA-2-methylthio-N6-dimethylallyladenosine synthase